MISQDLKLSERIEIIAIQSDKTSDRIHELSVQSDKTAIMRELAVQSDKFVIQMHELSVQVNELSNKTDKLKMSLQHPVTTLGGYQLSDRAVFYLLLFITLIICFLLLPASARWHAIIFFPTAIHDSIRSVWAVTTQEKVRELAAFVIFFWIISMFL